MAETTYSLNSPETNKLFSQKLNRVVLHKTTQMQFAGSGPEHAIEVTDELEKKAGDLIWFYLEVQNDDPGRQGTASQEGYEAQLETYETSLMINKIRHAFKHSGEISDQRVPWSFPRRARNALGDWWANKLDNAVLNHQCGYTVANPGGSTINTGNNLVTAPTTTIYANGSADSAVNTGFSVSLIDKAVNQAQIASTPIRPIKINGGEWYIQIVHPNAVRTMRGSTTQSYDVAKQRLGGSGSADSNPIFTGAIQTWNGTLIFSNKRVTPGINAGAAFTTGGVHRQPFFGAQSCMMAFGRGYSKGRFRWVEQTWDFNDKYAVSASCIFGVKKSVYNSADYATIVLVSADADPV